MTEYAPAAIADLFDQVQAAIPSAIMAGIIGDQAHDYGYHRGANYLPADDYSVQLPADQGGDGEAACGLDISWGNAADHYAVSARLLQAGYDQDPRTDACREFYGSTDGVEVCGYDYAANTPATSDDSHLWHVHLSIYRSRALTPLDDLADVIIGRDTATGGWDEMATKQEIQDALRAVLNEGTAKGQKDWAGTSEATLSTAQSTYNVANAAKSAATAAQAAAAAAQAAAEECLAALGELSGD